jgi:F5/8 type C domain
VFGYRTFGRLTAAEQKLFCLCATAYVVSVLAIYGVYSPVSNLIFHFVPVIGKMHIYQRFLLATGLFSAIMIALMVKAVEEERPPLATRLSLAVCGALTCVIAYLVSEQPETARLLRTDSHLVFELIVATLVLLVLLWPSRSAVYAAVTGLLFLVPLGQNYNYSQLGNTLAVQKTRIPLMLDQNWKDAVVTYIRQRSPKMLNKYVDMTPFWTPEGIESFPKSFPYFVQHDLDLSSYGGFSFYLSGRKAYTDRMPVRGETVALEPNWELVAAQGGDFVVAQTDQIAKGALDGVASAEDIADALLLPNNLKLVPLHSQRKRIDAERGTVYNNGYYRVRLDPVAEPASLVNLALGKPATQSGGGNAALAVDGNTDGNHARGSVSHTGQFQHAWLQVDLGAEQAVENVLVWNRTDCCAERLKDYWVFLSDEPFAEAATPAELARSPRVWSRRVTSAPSPSQQIDVGGRKARHVRVQLAGTSPLEASFLALAELQVFGRTAPAPTTGQNEIKVEGFSSNRANDVWIIFTTAKPMALDYLLSDNPKLTFLLNGKRILPTLSHDTLTFNLPAGRHHFRAVYRDRTLVAFWVLYGAYFLALVMALMWSLRTRSRARPAVA